jgi:KTSC domain-containing protein
MFREPVSSSSSIAALGYDDDTETLEVEFASGVVYRYRGVSQDTFEDFRQAPSKGAFFNQHIKDAYPWELVE